MFIHVRLLKGFSKTLTYKVPQEWQAASLVGKIIRVPIRDQFHAAIVLSQDINPPKNNTFTIKEAHSIEPFPNDPYYHKFVTQLALYYQTDPTHFIKRIQQFLHQKEVHERKTTLNQRNTNSVNTVTLTSEQQAIVNALTPHIRTPNYTPTLLHGVTSSGKTEIYKQLLIDTIAQKKSALLLLPEVTLARQFETLLQAQLPADTMLYSFHSGTSVKTKRHVWKALLEKQPIVLIGVHIPILLPYANLGLIIVDEEHESGYQEKKHPKVNSKEAAILRAKLHNIPILLGSATPSISSLYNVKKRGWHFFQLKKRFAGAFPKIKTVFLTDKKKKRRSFWISRDLEDAIKDRLEKKEQTIIFINRRGFSFFVQCKQCSFIFSCTNCSVSLTLHQNNNLTCHYCGYTQQMPSCCPACAAPEKQLLKKGVGTQQIVAILEKLFPYSRIGRADLDITSKKKIWEQTMHAFENGNLDILVGTQTITKGFHFPRVTLVGILWADLNLHFPIFNATETGLQQLVQVAGRAGRQHKESMVIVQAMIDHPVFNYLHEVDYLKFYAQELENRKAVGYPPYARLVELEIKNMNEQIIEHELAQILFQKLINARTSLNIKAQVLGPAKPPVYKVKQTHSRKIYLKAASIQDLIRLFQKIDKSTFVSQIFFTPNPTN